jgi:putative glutamine amidotransferase
MHAKPLIGLNADFRNAQRGKEGRENPAFSFVAAGYYDAIVKSGGIPLIVPPLENDEDVARILDVVDGMVLVGGADLDPRRDGFMMHPAVRLMDERREDFDRRLMEQIASRKLPVLGIGAGMQLLNVTLGGNLFLHLPEDNPRALPHKDLTDPHHRHALDVVPGTLMDRVYGEGELRVNSYHHMACDEIPTGFVVSARCPDGVVEAIESIRPDWWAVGVQFHPESSSASALDQRIFDEFCEATVDRKIHTGFSRPALQLVG